MASSAASANQRAFFRIATRLLVRAVCVTPDQGTALAAQIRSGLGTAAPEIDAALASWLQRLESKLDRILDHLGLADAPVFRPQDAQDVQLSGSGIQLRMDEDVARGAEVAIDLELPAHPPRRVRALAEVVEARPTADGLVALAFRVLRESDRDAIVSHTLEVERMARQRQQAE